jgi:aarF domain-containing kinase
MRTVGLNFCLVNMAATPDPASQSRVYAPVSAASADGFTRSMCAMALFNAAKEEYAKVDPTAPDANEQRTACHRKHAKEALQFAIDNGGVYIKAAQFVASLQGGAGEAGVPREYVEAFKPLTDRVPPRHYEAVAQVAEEELGQPLTSLVESLDEWPVAAASLAQVHCAYLPAEGKLGRRKVAVKLQYPTLQEQMASDFETLKMMATMIAPNGYDFGWIIDDIQKYVTSELDFTREALNSRAASDALASLAPSVLVPPVVSQLSTRRVMTTEFLDGLTRLDRPAELRALQLEPLAIGVLVGTAFSQLPLEYGLVHGDPHAGNVYARVRPPVPGAAPSTTSPSVPQPQLVILDHGLYHRLSDTDRLAVCDLILACATPWPNRAEVLRLSGQFAGALAPLFPALISPAFAFATGLNVKQLRAAAEGR